MAEHLKQVLSPLAHHKDRVKDGKYICSLSRRSQIMVCWGVGQSFRYFSGTFHSLLHPSPSQVKAPAQYDSLKIRDADVFPIITLLWTHRYGRSIPFLVEHCQNLNEEHFETIFSFRKTGEGTEYWRGPLDVLQARSLKHLHSPKKKRVCRKWRKIESQLAYFPILRYI